MPLVTRIPTGYDALTGEVRAWDWREEFTTEIRETMKVLIATEKPFAQKAVEGIRHIVEEAGYELALLEKYTDKAQLLEAVADVDALIIRSDKVTAEVIAAAPQLKIVVRAGAGYDNVDLAAATARGHRRDEYPGAELERRGRTGHRHDDLHLAQPLHRGHRP